MSNVIRETSCVQNNLMLFELLRVVNLGHSMELLSARVQQPISSRPRQDQLGGDTTNEKQVATNGCKSNKTKSAKTRTTTTTTNKQLQANQTSHLASSKGQQQIAPLIDCSRPLDLTLTRRAEDEEDNLLQGAINYSLMRESTNNKLGADSIGSASLFRCNRPPPIALNLAPTKMPLDGAVDNPLQATGGNRLMISSSTSPSCRSKARNNLGGGSSSSSDQSPTESRPQQQQQPASDVIISSTIASKRRRRQHHSRQLEKQLRDINGNSNNNDNNGGSSRSHGCNHCGRSFSRSDMLTRHLRLHSGLKPYQCAKCLQVFSRSDHLSTHERTHTGEKPYQCDICAYSACRRDMITRHRRTHSSRSRRVATNDNDNNNNNNEPIRRHSNSNSVASKSPEENEALIDEQPDSLTGDEHSGDHRQHHRHPEDAGHEEIGGHRGSPMFQNEHTYPSSRT